MALSVEDVAREVRAVFALRDAGDDADFCNVITADARCDRHHLHHGKHAHLTGFHYSQEKGWWAFSRVVVWK